MSYFKLGKDTQLVTKDLYNTVMKHKGKIESDNRLFKDYNIDYFGFKTLKRAIC